jgi:UDP-glucose 4-epimerase
VLVTGAAGFIGSHVADALAARGDEVAGIDDLSSGDQRFISPGTRFEQVDIRSPEAAQLVRSFAPDGICHLAAQISVSVSVREPLLDADLNITGTLNLLVAAVEVGSRFVFSSSGGQVYGEPEEIPTPETAPLRPVSPYGVSKLAAEQYLYQAHVQHGFGYAALRYSNVYGPRQNPHGEAGVVAIFCEGLLGRRRFKIHGPGTDTRDYVYVADVVRANLLALDSQRSGHYNIGSGRETDVNTLYALVARRFGSNAEPEHGPERPGDIRRSAVDASLAARELGWQPEVGLDEGIGRTVDWFRSGAER